MFHSETVRYGDDIKPAIFIKVFIEKGWLEIKRRNKNGQSNSNC